MAGQGRPRTAKLLTRTIDLWWSFLGGSWNWVGGYAVNGQNTPAVYKSVNRSAIFKCASFLSAHGESGTGKWIWIVW